MNQNDNYKYLFFKKLYSTLKLKDVDEKIKEENINHLDIEKINNYEIISNYFFLLNKVDLSKLTPAQLQLFYELFSKDVCNLSENELIKAEKFIDETYKLILFPNIESKFTYYGPININYACPTDAIALGLYYDAFNDNDFDQLNKLNEIINYIQFEVAKKLNLKIAVFTYNQLSLDNIQQQIIK